MPREKQGIRLCVISHACFKSVNRRVYVLLQEKGIEIDIVVPILLRGEEADPPRSTDPSIHYLPISSENPRTYMFIGVEQILNRRKPDMVMVEADPLSRLSISAGSWCKKNDAKLLCLSVENLDFGLLEHIRRAGIRSAPQALAKSLLHLRARKLVDQVFTINREGSDIFRKYAYRRVTQVPLGFDPQIFHPDARARSAIRTSLGISDNALVIGYFGRATRQKGVHLIINALTRSWAREKYDWRMIMDNFQPDKQYTAELKRQIVRSGLADKVILFDADHQGIAKYMAATDVAVLASLSSPTAVEQYGRVIPEAMACGALAVVSDSGAPKDLVGEFGIIFPEGNVDWLAQKLLSIAADGPSYTAIATAGSVHAIASLSIQKQADVYYEAMSFLRGMGCNETSYYG